MLIMYKLNNLLKIQLIRLADIFPRIKLNFLKHLIRVYKNCTFFRDKVGEKNFPLFPFLLLPFV